MVVTLSGRRAKGVNKKNPAGHMLPCYRFDLKMHCGFFDEQRNVKTGIDKNNPTQSSLMTR